MITKYHPKQIHFKSNYSIPHLLPLFCTLIICFSHFDSAATISPTTTLFPNFLILSDARIFQR